MQQLKFLILFTCTIAFAVGIILASRLILVSEPASSPEKDHETAQSAA